MKYITLTLLSIVTLLGGCASSVNTDYNSQHDFSNYEQYQWAGTKTDTEAYVEFGGDIFDSRLQSAVNNALGGRGMTQSDVPEFVVQYHLNTKERAYPDNDLRFGQFYFYGHPYYRRQFLYQPVDFGPQRTRFVTVGTLTMQVKDISTQRVVWTSTAKTFLSENDGPVISEEKITDLAFKMFAEFPPITLPTSWLSLSKD